MNTHEQRCPHCRAKNGADVAPVVPEPIALPDPMPSTAAPFRIHYSDGHTQDCTLHPDGRLTMTAGGSDWRSALTFEEMADTSWNGAHIEWNPQPLEPAAAVPAVVVQDALLPVA
ncbi:hypothetical protein [Streptomyces anulatus]|uniref:hypothetical protein n=1 Tax=Streptomyces anulatus TaxID=1892 RepID=UPI00324C82DB|nr:hypothetical protein OH791_17250 [Streptomyces anulatus]